MASSRHPVAGAVAALVIGIYGSASADQTDPKLAQAFADLKAAQTPEAAQQIEAGIWEAWGQSHNAAVDQLMAMGVARLSAGDYAAALATFDQVVAMSPKFAEGWNKRATTLYLMRRYADSERDIGRTLALEPRHFGALSGLSMCELQMKRTKQALDALQRAQAIDPNLPDIARNIDELKRQLAQETI